MSGEQKVKVPIDRQVSAMEAAVPVMRAHLLQTFHINPGVSKEQTEQMIEEIEAGLRTLRWFQANEQRVKQALRGS